MQGACHTPGCERCWSILRRWSWPSARHGDLDDTFMAGADYILDSLAGAGTYNHLSVRSAVSIILDRLLGNLQF